ncbi:glycosyltransferase involved in cell wall biosynthesis [Bacillus fengqiuensis]|nr:glycosyltransferase involved in cell wall biosynthesis [Bacillus fengqiuensis]
MKKKILFVMNNLSSGGAEKSLSSLLQIIDYSKYDVDLLLFKSGGIFFSNLPPQVNILQEPDEYQYFDMPIRRAITDCIKRGRIDTALSRVRASYIFRKEKNKARCEQRAWKYMSKPLKKIDKTYDIAIGYLEKSSIYFVVDKVKAKRKIGWIHTNYSNSGMDNNLDNPYFQQLDYIVTVSEECVQSLKDNFAHLKNKIRVVGNIVSPQTINSLSNNEIQDDFISDADYTNIVTVARLGHEKGIDMAIKACDLLVRNGYKAKWYVLGYGTEKESSENLSLIENNGLRNHFKLLGVKENPYPYIRKADIYVQPSRYEGKSIAIDEAKILHKPIVVTNFSTAKDQIENEENGIIVDMDPESIYEGIKKLIEDKKLRNSLMNNLAKEKLGTEHEVQKLYELFR